MDLSQFGQEKNDLQKNRKTTKCSRLLAPLTDSTCVRAAYQPQFPYYSRLSRKIG